MQHKNGYYVYLWYRNHLPFPFYIGYGKRHRYLNVHKKKGDLAYCEYIRQQSKHFKAVRIITNITKREALVVEAVLIKLFRRMGVPLTNQISGHSTQFETELKEKESQYRSLKVENQQLKRQLKKANNTIDKLRKAFTADLSSKLLTMLNLNLSDPKIKGMPPKAVDDSPTGPLGIASQSTKRASTGGQRTS